MVSAGSFRNGLTIEYNEKIYQIIEFQHVKPGKGAAFVRCKMKDIINGATIEHTFRPSERVPRAHIDRKDMEYLYSDGDMYHFMDGETFEQVAVNQTLLGDEFKFVKENQVVKILSHNDTIFGIEVPNIVELAIQSTEPGFKGDTSSGGTKPAVLETGAEVSVPLFIDIGEVVRIDTESGDYLGRA